MTHDHDPLGERVREAYHEAPLDDEAARARLLEKLHREPAPQVPAAGASNAGRGAWWPAFAAGALMIVFMAGALTGWLLARRAAAPVPAAIAESESGVPVVFALPAPGARIVALVGDFNGWDAEATPLHRAALGNVWIAEVRLARGLHTYAFVVDGERWIPDPGAPLAPENEFGTHTSVVIVGESVS